MAEMAEMEAMEAEEVRGPGSAAVEMEVKEAMGARAETVDVGAL
jgi:hypothetical protein